MDSSGNKKFDKTSSQKIDVKCTKCGNIKNISYIGHKCNRINNKTEYICHSCIGISNCIKNAKFQKNKTYEEMYGKNISKELKYKVGSARRGISHEIIYGKKRAKQIKHAASIRMQKFSSLPWKEKYNTIQYNKMKHDRSIRMRGKGNPMYGKPSPQGSGNGWSGWYKDWYFRSLKELSFMVNYIERYNHTWISAEASKYGIKYKYFGNIDRTYYADFILDNEIMAEIKPLKLRNTPLVLLKEEAAKLWCNKNNLKYILFTDDMFDILTYSEIDQLIYDKKLKWLDRYADKYNKLKKEKNH